MSNPLVTPTPANSLPEGTLPFASERRILIIDDTPSVLEDYKKILLTEDNAADEGLDDLENALFDDESDEISQGMVQEGFDKDQYKFQVDCATQGKDGFELAKKAVEEGRPYQLAFVDMRMPPGWDGLQTIQAIMKVDSQIHFVICTAYSDFTWAETMKQIGSGASDRVLILKKPFDIMEVWQLAIALTEKFFQANAARIRKSELEELVQIRTSELLKAQENLINARDLAVEASQSKSRFLSNMSHEIRTPLNAVVSLASLLKGSNLDEDQDEMLSIMLNSSDHLLSLINDVLDLSKIEAGKFELESLPFNIKKCVIDTLNLFASKSQEKRINLFYEIPDELDIPAHGDITRFRQIISNLLSNAIKFTNQGSINVKVSCIGQQPCSRDVVIEIRDTGIGMDSATQEKIFEEFQQANNTTARAHGGTGLGLPISRYLAQQMGGNLTVASQEGQGSTFNLKLPFNFEGKLAERTLSTHKLPPQINCINLCDTEFTLENYLEQQGVQINRFDKESLMQSEANTFPDCATLLLTPSTDNALIEKLSSLSAAKTQTHFFFLTDPFYTLPSTSTEQLPVSGHFSMPLCLQDVAFAIAIIEKAREASGTIPFINKQAMLNLRKPSNTSGTSQEAGNTGSQDVLIVDDNAVNQEVAQMIFEGLDCNVSICNNGLEAIELLANESYDIIFMDCFMPIMDGFTATKEIRKRESTTGKHTTIVAMTACTAEDEVKRCYDSGMDDFLSKPAKPKRIQEMLQKWKP